LRRDGECSRQVHQQWSFFAESATKVIRLVGDATHDESWQKLKLLRIGFAACHFTDGSWKSTFFPVLQCLCHEESKEVLDLCLQALIHIFQTRHGINLVDFVLECFWDGRIEAMEKLREFFPDAHVHLCLEHAKRNLAKRYPHTGFKQLIKNTIEMIAFTPPVVFYVCADEFILASLAESWEDTSYLTTARQGSVLLAIGAVLTLFSLLDLLRAYLSSF
jgi:hypothetical protein